MTIPAYSKIPREPGGGKATSPRVNGLSGQFVISWACTDLFNVQESDVQAVDSSIVCALVDGCLVVPERFHVPGARPANYFAGLYYRTVSAYSQAYSYANKYS